MQEVPYGQLYSADQKYCEKCNRLLLDKELEIKRQLLIRFNERHTSIEVNGQHILELCQWFYNNKYDEFLDYFGSKGIEMLEKAVKK